MINNFRYVYFLSEYQKKIEIRLYALYVYYWRISLIDPECQTINTKHQCYVSDPSCPPQKPDEQTGSLNTSVAISVSLGVFLIIAVAAIALCMFCRRKRSKTGTF